MRSLLVGLLASLTTLINGGCAYRFTNAHVVPPSGIHTVAVEAVFDTGREVLPHELLWEALQAAFASDGHLRLAAQSKADALVRAHIRDAHVTPAGEDIITDTNLDGSRKVGDPSLFNHGQPPRPNEFRHITQTDEYRSRANIATVVDIEVWDLNKHVLISKSTYAMNGMFQAVHAAGSLTTVNNDHLRYMEASRARFKTIAESLANNVVQALLVH